MKMDSKRSLLRWFSLAGAVVVALLAQGLTGNNLYAYAYNTCNGNPIKWNGGWTNMYLNTTSFTPGGVWDSRVQNAMWHWNNVKGSGFNFYVGRTSGGVSSGNGMNEVYFTWDNLNGALAVTKTRYHCYWFFGWNYGMDEADIAFNLNYSWSPWDYDYSSPGGPPYNFEGVALHELGHAQGFNHEDRWQATMNSIYPNGGPFGHWKEWDPSADDRQAARYFYYDGTTEADIAASAVKYTGSGTSWTVSSPSWAYRGTYVTMEFTFSNLGTSTQNFDIGFYLSNDSYIDTSDTWLGANYGAWASPGSTGTFTRTVYIPGWIAPGTYYLGFILDPYNYNWENNKSNNHQEMPRTITIY